MATQKTLDLSKAHKEGDVVTSHDAATIVKEKKAALEALNPSQESNPEDKYETLTRSANIDAKNYEERIYSLEKENKALNDKLAKTEEKYKETKNSEKSKQKEIDKYKKMADELTTTLNEHVSNKVLHQFIGLQVKLDDALDSLASANRDVKLLEKINQDEQNKNSDLTKEINELIAEKAMLNQQVLDAVKKDPDIVNKMERLEHANQELLDQLASLQNYATDKENEAEQLKSERVSTAQENEIIKNTLVNQENSIETLTETLTETMARYEALRQDNQKGKEERADLSDQLYQLQQELKVSLNQKAELEQTLKELEENNHALKEDNEHIKGLYENSMDEKTQSLSEALAAQMALKKSQEELTETKESNVTLSEKAEQNELLYKDAEIRIITLEQDRNDKNQLMDKQLTDLAILKQDNEALKQENTQLNQDVRSQGEAYKAWKEEFNLQYGAALKAIETLKAGQSQNLIEKDNKIKALEEQITQLTKDKSLYDTGRSYLVNNEAIPLLIKQGYDTINPDYYTKSQYLSIITSLQEENALLKQKTTVDSDYSQFKSLEEENKNLKMGYIVSTSFERLAEENDYLRASLKKTTILDAKNDELENRLNDVKGRLLTAEKALDDECTTVLSTHNEYSEKAKSLEAEETALSQKLTTEAKTYTDKIALSEGVEEREQAELAYQAFLEKKDTELKALAVKQNELKDIKETVILNNPSLKELNDHVIALKEEQERYEQELDTYINQELSQPKRELLLEYQEKMLKQSLLHDELRKRETFLNTLRSTNNKVRDYMLKENDYKNTLDDAQKALLYSEIKALRLSDDIKVYEQVLKQIDALSTLSQNLYKDCEHIREEFKQA